jgi:hypothetical protein
VSRYKVGSVTGFMIGRQPGGANGGHGPISIWYVLDSADCYRIVSEHRNKGGRGYSINGEQEAYEHAAELERDYP